MHLQNNAHAKINLFLHVTGKREDGYHLLDSLAIFAGAHDTLILHPSTQLEPRLRISGRFSNNLNNHQDNLILKAASLLRDFITYHHICPKNPLSSFEIDLIKELPVASGIGGGSADAAAALRLLQQYYDIPFSIIEEIAPKLGADVPVCLAQKSKRMQNIGDILLDVPSLPPFGILLVNPGVGVSTASIFKKLALPHTNQKNLSIEFPSNGFHNLEEFISFLQTTRNDLELPAIEEAPIIQTVLNDLNALPHTLLARMSGSGATCFAIFKNEHEALLAQNALSLLPHTQKWWHWAGALLA